jgi:hypothetical protein
MTALELDPRRRAIGAHELGHALAWHSVGLEVHSITVRGRGGSVDGTVSIDTDKPYRDAAQVRGYVVGILAGTEAGIRWCEETGDMSLSDHARGCKVDMALFRKHRKNPCVANVSERELRNEARAVVRAHWNRLTALVPKLAARGSVRL